MQDGTKHMSDMIVVKQMYLRANLTFTAEGFSDYVYWQTQDKISCRGHYKD